MAISYANVQNPKDNFTFKCHRSNGVTNGFQDIYAVNDIAFHPVHGKKANFDTVLQCFSLDFHFPFFFGLLFSLLLMEVTFWISSIFLYETIEPYALTFLSNSILNSAGVKIINTIGGFL